MSIEISDKKIIYKYIYICSRSSRFVYPFSPYTRIFKVSTRVCTIKNKMVEGFLETKIFRNAHTDTRAQQLLFESSEGSTKVPSVTIDGTLVGLRVY